MTDNGPCDVPLIELLRKIPNHTVLQWEYSVPLTHCQSPVGRYCHQAADKIEQLEAENAALRKALTRTLSWLTSYPGGGALGAYEEARAALAEAE